MKYYLYYLIIAYLFSFISCNNGSNNVKNISKKEHNGYIIRGTLSESNSRYIYLLDEKKRKKDSVYVKNHSFTLQGIVNKPSVHFIKLQNTNKSYFIALENAEYTILIDSNRCMMIGGKLNTRYSKYQSQKNSYAQQKSDFLDKFSRLDLGLKSYLKHVDSIRRIEKVLLTNFIINNHNNILSSMLLSSTELTSKEAIKLKSILVNKGFKKQLIKQLEDKINQIIITETEDKISRRKPVPLFSGINLEGKQTHLEKILRGKKAFLIDFWASWCPPCRETSPKLKEIYQKYNHKGFDILTISEDRSVTDWKNGVFIDNIEEWHHIYDDFNRISLLFNVGALPHMVLIDENKKIIKNNISISDLENQLENIFTLK